MESPGQHGKSGALGAPASDRAPWWSNSNISNRLIARHPLESATRAPTRWKLRRAVGAVGEGAWKNIRTKPSSAGSSKASTCLGTHLGPEGLTTAARTLEPFVEPALRLYEQEPGELGGSSRLGLYVRRWVRWTGRGGSGGQSQRGTGKNSTRGGTRRRRPHHLTSLPEAIKRSGDITLSEPAEGPLRAYLGGQSENTGAGYARNRPTLTTGNVE